MEAASRARLPDPKALMAARESVKALVREGSVMARAMATCSATPLVANLTEAEERNSPLPSMTASANVLDLPY